ncbi:hypothetical protein BK708_11845 [Bacillus thuringiensis serovar yunnanensis]|nr:hypothetical protein BK708_11845 [Bacillus thuringiensis serovar yunnanensis]
MEVATLMVVKQPLIQVEDVTGFTTNQEQMKKHANEWLNTYKFKTMASSEQILNFNRILDSFYDKLLESSKKINNEESSHALSSTVYQR